ncbi:hypothetical protein GZH46_02081, partial [Fragariocoptes setiger]
MLQLNSTSGSDQFPRDEYKQPQDANTGAKKHPTLNRHVPQSHIGTNLAKYDSLTIPPPNEFTDHEATEQSTIIDRHTIEPQSSLSHDHAAGATSTNKSGAGGHNPMDTEIITRLVRTKQAPTKSSKRVQFRRPSKTVLEQELMSPVADVRYIEYQRSKSNNQSQVESSRDQQLVEPLALIKQQQHMGGYKEADAISKLRSMTGGQCKFNTKVSFESDADSHCSYQSNHSEGAGEGTDDNNNNNSNNIATQQRQVAHQDDPTYKNTIKRSFDTGSRELLTETKFKKLNRLLFHRNKHRKSTTNDCQDEDATNISDLSRSNISLNAPDWDYSLVVNRMKGNVVDSRIK